MNIWLHVAIVIFAVITSSIWLVVSYIYAVNVASFKLEIHPEKKVKYKKIADAVRPWFMGISIPWAIGIIVLFLVHRFIPVIP